MAEEIPVQKMVSVEIPEWLAEAGKVAAQKQGIAFDEMVRLVVYEYAEKHALTTLQLIQSAHLEQIPVIVRLANSLLVSSIQKGASEMRLASVNGQVRVTASINGQEEELILYPSHIRPQLYDRFVSMALGTPGVMKQGIQKASFPVTGSGTNYDVFLSWNGDYNAEMVLRIVKGSDK